MKKIISAALMLLVLAPFSMAYDPLGLKLPTTPVTINLPYWNSEGPLPFLNVGVSNVPAGSWDVNNGMYYGWCANPDEDIFIYVNYDARLYSTYDDSLPGHVQDSDWPKINYLINEFKKGHYSCAQNDEVQMAIWTLLPHTQPLSSYNSYGWDVDWNCVDSIVQDATDNGGAFVPSSGDMVGVVCDTGSTVQVVFIEIPYYLAPEVLGAIAAIGLASPAFGYLLVKRRKRN